jgi:hypothetical protein
MRKYLLGVNTTSPKCDITTEFLFEFLRIHVGGVVLDRIQDIKWILESGLVVASKAVSFRSHFRAI